MLTDLGRRVLGHLPVYAEDEEAHIEAEGGPELSIRSYTLEKFTARLAEDESSPDMDEGHVLDALTGLADSGLCGEDESGGWRMTKGGLDALLAPSEIDQVPGAVLVDVNPAQAKANAIGD